MSSYYGEESVEEELAVLEDRSNETKKNKRQRTNPPRCKRQQREKGASAVFVNLGTDRRQSPAEHEKEKGMLHGLFVLVGRKRVVRTAQAKDWPVVTFEVWMMTF